MTGLTALDQECSIADDSTVGSTSTAGTARFESNDVIEMTIQQENVEQGDGGDSDEEGEGYGICNDFHEACVDTNFDKQMNDYDEIEANVAADDDNGITGQVDASNPVCHLDGAPEGWLPPGIPDGLTHTAKSARGESAFASIDNPDSWSAYTYKAKFSGTGGSGPYKDNRMPAGATVVPCGPANGEKSCGWL